MSTRATVFVIISATVAGLVGMVEPFAALPSAFVALCIIADEICRAIRESR